MRTIIYGTLILAVAGAMALDWSRFEQVTAPDAELIQVVVLIVAAVLGGVVLLDGVITSATNTGTDQAVKNQLAQLSEEVRDLRTKNQDLIAQVSSANYFEAELETAKIRAGELEKALQGAKVQLADMKSVQVADDAGHKDVIAFLSVLQKKGRLIDFLMDDISAYSDPQVGAAARIVHQGCAGVLKEYFAIEPIHREKEGAPVTFEGDIDVSRYRILGKADGTPPFNGKLIHHGWRTERINIPKSVLPESDVTVIAPAEVELG